MRSRILLVLAFSLSGCATIRRPEIQVCQVIAAEDTVNPRLGCYAFKDFGDDGNVKPGTKPIFHPLQDLRSLNKYMTFYSDAGPTDAIAKLKAYIKKLREEYDNGCKPKN